MVRGSVALVVALAVVPAWAEAGGGEPSLQVIEDGFGGRSHAETVRLLESWLDAHAGDPDTARAATWAGHLLRQDDHLPAARRAYQRAIAQGGIWSFRAYSALGDLELDDRRFTAAIAAYEGASASPESYWANYARDSIVKAEGARREAYAARGCVAALSLETALFGIVAWRRKGKTAFWPLPWEIKFYFPFAVVMTLAAWSIQPAKRSAIRAVCWGGLALIGGFAVYSRAASLTPAKRLLGSLLAMASAAALVYASLVAFGLAGTLGNWGDD
jgi:hypothetical protein